MKLMLILEKRNKKIYNTVKGMKVKYYRSVSSACLQVEISQIYTSTKRTKFSK